MLRAPLKPVLMERMWVTIQLAVGAAIIWLLVGIPIGILSALRPRSIWDRAAMTFALIGISMPVFFIGPLALYVFVYKWHILPGSGYSPIGEDGVWQWFNHFILPWCVLALLYAAFYARLSRANLLDVMGEDYMRTARAKGLNERQVIVKHGLRSSLTPLVTVFGLDLAGLLAGAVITETVFNLPGLGQYAVRSVFSLGPLRDPRRHRHRGLLRRDRQPRGGHRLRVPRPPGSVHVIRPLPDRGASVA